MMTLRRQALLVVAGMAVCYAAYPYFTLYRLAHAVSQGDSETLSTLVSWESVRDGVKEDICDAITETPTEEATKEGTLPPFGYSFIRGVAANAVDANITPEALVSAVHLFHPSAEQPAGMRLTWAFFDSPRRFEVAVGMPGSTGPANELRMQMEFRHARWVVTRAWLPSSLLMAANSRT